MATTTRKNKLDKIKVEKIKTEEKDKVLINPNFLTPDHLMMLEVNLKEVENSKLSMSIQEQVLQNLILSLENLQHKIEKQRVVLQQAAMKYESSKKKSSSLRADIWPIYGFGLDDLLSYDPITGEIKRD